MSKHFHVYKRTDIGKRGPYIVYKCMECPSYITPELLLGQEARCPRCDDLYRIELHHLSLAVPHCDKCTQRREEASV